ncbi:MAG: ferrous iron transport protein A [Clostridia bacterium]|nr:ferrous iron transport protein A [Clostridia bacterium]
MLLFNCQFNKTFVIKKILVLDKKLLRRLSDLGITRGAKIYIERASLKKACFIVVVNQKRVAISKQIAMEIEV